MGCIFIQLAALPRRPVTHAIATAQSDLFGVEPALPPGLAFVPAFIDADEERELMSMAVSLPLNEARYKQYTARRRVHAWGTRYDFGEGRLRPGDLADLPPPLQRLRQRLAAWAGVAADDLAHVMVAEYRPGTPLGWHRDAPGYELIAGVSLGGVARLRFRPWPPEQPSQGDVIALDLAPRSAYSMRGTARWGWQHSIPPVPALRYSVTMRTLRGKPPHGSDGA